MTSPNDPSAPSNDASSPATPGPASPAGPGSSASPTGAPARRPVEPFDRARFVAIAISVVALASGTALPSGHFTDESGTPVMWRGATFVLCGWFGPMMGGPICGWYANPMLILDESGTPVMWRGATFVLCGWFGPMMGGPICGWYANPMLILGWILLALRRYRGASIVLVIAAVLAISSASLFGVAVWQNEGGVNNLRLQHFGIGFYVWLVGVLAPTGLAIAGWRRDRGFAKHGPAPRSF
jgi:hypothetical protein